MVKKGSFLIINELPLKFLMMILLNTLWEVWNILKNFTKIDHPVQCHLAPRNRHCTQIATAICLYKNTLLLKSFKAIFSSPGTKKACTICVLQETLRENYKECNCARPNRLQTSRDLTLRWSFDNFPYVISQKQMVPEHNQSGANCDTIQHFNINCVHLEGHIVTKSLRKEANLKAKELWLFKR